jgi:hypothetical protein
MPKTKERVESVETQAKRASDYALTAIDVPVGVTLTVADWAGEVVETWTSRKKAERELRGYRDKVAKRIEKIEKRGVSARKDATERVNGVPGDLGDRVSDVGQRVQDVRYRIEREARRGRTRVEELVRGRPAEETVQS